MIGVELGINPWVCCTDAFTQAGIRNFTHWWKEWTAANGFGGLLFYELRHTQATLLINAGANLQAVKTQMGHSSLAVTQIYTHTDEAAQRGLSALLPTA